jgi:cytidylate kinase
MIVNLIGHIASGKTTFARWFIARHPSWKYYSIDQMRREASRSRLSLAKEVPRTSHLPHCEDFAWRLMLQAVSGLEAVNCIIESTGTIYRLRDLWHPLVDKGIYTVKLVATREECQERARKRKKEKIPGYDLPEVYGITIEDEHQLMVPANLIVNVPDMTEAEQEEVYEKVEKYILKAKRCFEIYKIAEVIGKNNLT